MGEAAGRANEFDSQLVTVERAVPADAEAIFDVQRQTWLDTYPNEELGISSEDIRARIEGEHGQLVGHKIEYWRERIESGGDDHDTFVARMDGRIVGFVVPEIEYGERWISAIYVLPEAQAHGVGSKLMRRALEWHGGEEDIHLKVASYNNKAIQFYERFGFEIDHTRPDEAVGLNDGKEIPTLAMVLRAKTQKRTN